MRPFEGFEDRTAETPRAARTASRSRSRPFRRARLDSNLIIDFFFDFSRFEYALKRTGYVNSRNAYVEADWKGFTRAIRHKYRMDYTPAFRQAATYLLENPPKQ